MSSLERLVHLQASNNFEVDQVTNILCLFEIKYLPVDQLKGCVQIPVCNLWSSVISSASVLSRRQDCRRQHHETDLLAFAAAPLEDDRW